MVRRNRIINRYVNTPDCENHTLSRSVGGGDCDVMLKSDTMFGEVKDMYFGFYFKKSS